MQLAIPKILKCFITIRLLKLNLRCCPRAVHDDNWGGNNRERERERENWRKKPGSVWQRPSSLHAKMLPLLPSWPNYKAQGAEIFHYVMQRIDYNPTTTFTKSTIVLRWVISFTDGARSKFQDLVGRAEDTIFFARDAFCSGCFSSFW